LIWLVDALVRLRKSLNLSGFVVGRRWCTCERVGIDETFLFSRDWLANG
jgi:hypothetical protein